MEKSKREERWRAARQVYTAALLNPLEELWSELQLLLQAGEDTRWQPFLELCSSLGGFGPLCAGVLADHLRLTGFFSNDTLSKCPVTGSVLVEDRDEYCYIGLTGCCKGVSSWLGLAEADFLALTSSQRLRWLRRVSVVQKALYPTKVGNFK